jgi:hypothetical protein
VTGNGIELEGFRPFRAEGEWKKAKVGQTYEFRRLENVLNVG